jgi:nucleoside-diphosphate-sugar epimerase
MFSLRRSASTFLASSAARSFGSTSSLQITVAVTGGTGYIGSFVVAELLTRGYDVHAPVRGSSTNAAKAAHLLALPNADGKLKIFDGGDLSLPGSFDSAFADADAVIHTAAEVVLGASESIVTASVDGTNNVLSSVDKSPGVKRFVQTSSIAAIQKYDMPIDHVFTENDWNDWSTIANGDAYGVAKGNAERLVHAHFKDDKNGRTAVAVNPVVVLGPVMTKGHTKASAVFLREIIYGNKMMNFPASFVDVRDIAIGHVNALEKLPEFHGRRFILSSDTPCDPQGAIGLAAIASRVLPGKKFEGVPKFPDFLMAIARPLSLLPVVGKMIMSEHERIAQSTPIHVSNKAARNDLGVDFRPLDTTIKEGVESIVEKGFAKLRSTK